MRSSEGSETGGSAAGGILFLVGFMGSGKSHWGRRLAGALGCPFHDLDEELERDTGMGISAIFRAHGEEWFRERERAVLQALTEGLLSRMSITGMPNRIAAVVATGGGTPCFLGNMGWMKGHGTTVWLNPPPEVLEERLRKGMEWRPLLQGTPPDELAARIRERLSQRLEFYRQADVETDGIEETVESLLQKIKHA